MRVCVCWQRQQQQVCRLCGSQQWRLFLNAGRSLCLRQAATGSAAQCSCQHSLCLPGIYLALLFECVRVCAHWIERVMRALPPPFYSTKGKAANDTPHTPLTLKQLWPGMYLHTNVTGWGSLWTAQTTGSAGRACENGSSLSQVVTWNDKVGGRLGHRHGCLGMLLLHYRCPSQGLQSQNGKYRDHFSLQLMMWRWSKLSSAKWTCFPLGWELFKLNKTSVVAPTQLALPQDDQDE